mmetsp:Transcript_59249/g.150375  ORF Transcript_59249/g.150375 Transcript_59249/m.150375 type:complete len:219 (+) Transcript_59249:616-1272(+)
MDSKTASARSSSISTLVQVSSSKMICFCVIRSEAQSRKIRGKESFAEDSPKVLAPAAKAFNNASRSKSSRARAVAFARRVAPNMGKRLSACSSRWAWRMCAALRPRRSPRSATSRFSKCAGSLYSSGPPNFVHSSTARILMAMALYSPTRCTRWPRKSNETPLIWSPTRSTVLACTAWQSVKASATSLRYFAAPALPSWPWWTTSLMSDRKCSFISVS